MTLPPNIDRSTSHHGAVIEYFSFSVGKIPLLPHTHTHTHWRQLILPGPLRLFFSMSPNLAPRWWMDSTTTNGN